MTARFYGLAMLFYTPTTYPGQGTAQEGRPGLGGALTYAHVRSIGMSRGRGRMHRGGSGGQD